MLQDNRKPMDPYQSIGLFWGQTFRNGPDTFIEMIGHNDWFKATISNKIAMKFNLI